MVSEHHLKRIVEIRFRFLEGFALGEDIGKFFKPTGVTAFRGRLEYRRELKILIRVHSAKIGSDDPETKKKGGPA
jgi:hypothetical protein